MPIDIKMPALSPTMEQGTVSKWLVKEGDTVASGDLLAEIETDKATMEFEAVDEGTILSLAIPAGTEGVKVGTVIATMAAEGEDASAPPPAAKAEPTKDKPVPSDAAEETAPPPAPAAKSATITAVSMSTEGRILASPLAKRIAAEKGVDLSSLSGTGPHGRIVKADVEGAKPGTVAPKAAAAALATAATATTAPAAASAASTKLTDAIPDFGIPFEDQKLSGMRKTIARRLTESKQQVPHIYLTVDVRLDALLKLRAELNDAISARGVKLSVNDMLIKALGLALEDPFLGTGDSLIPAGFTYFGQFVDHDITFDRTEGLPDGSIPVEEIEQGRTPALELDSVYGRGPAGSPELYEPDGLRLRTD